LPIAGILAVVAMFLGRFPEHPELDQSLFLYYGRWLAGGLHLYTDLWDSKPPVIFLLYAAADRIAGPTFGVGLLMLLSGVASAILTYVLVRRGADRATAYASAAFVALLWNGPAFGGALSSAQAEVLMAPALLAAAILSGRTGPRAGFAAGCCLGLAASFKIVAVFMWPLAWVFALAGERLSVRRNLSVLAGCAVVPLVCAIALAAQGGLGEAIRAVLEYPRAYAAEINQRIDLLPALQRAATRMGRGFPLTLLLAAIGVGAGFARLPVRASVAWLFLAIVGVVSQRLMSGYHLYLLAPPLGLLAGFGARAAWKLLATAWAGARARRVRACIALLLLSAGLGTAAASETRWWGRQYRNHVALLRGEIDIETFRGRQSAYSALWFEARDIGTHVRTLAHAGDTMLVWGLAPAVYLQAGLPPATRFAFHQTFFVDGSALGTRWPSTGERRAELLQRMREAPPRFVVVVRGDRNGFEPSDSEIELRAFPELAQILATAYTEARATHNYTLLVHGSPNQRESIR
jgi:hypothetical protein